jgi:hypothetical protein
LKLGDQHHKNPPPQKYLLIEGVNPGEFSQDDQLLKHQFST